MRRLDQILAVVAGIDPDAYGTGAQNSDTIDMRDFEQVMFVVQAGTLGSSATLNFKVTQGNTSGMGGEKDITGKAITQLTEAGTDSDKEAVVVVKQSDLDVAGGFRWIRGVATLGVATSDYGMVAIGGYPTFGPATDYDMSSVDEVVA